MEISLIYELEYTRPWHDTHSRDTYHQALEQIELADRVGFDKAWALEYHFLTEFSHCSAPKVFHSATAERTDRIRIGHGVVILVANHPVRVAERIAALDIISDGRVEFGTGRFLTPQELGGFNVPPEESMPMYREALETVPRMRASEGPVSFDGEYWSMPEREVHPKPIQTPHPRMYRAATQPGSCYESGREGLGALGFTLLAEPEDAARLVDEYHEGQEEQDAVPARVTDHTGLATMGLCTGSERRARELVEDAVIYYHNQALKYFTSWGQAIQGGT